MYLYEDGTVIARDGEINRENVPLRRIPRIIQHAVLAAEDRDFYSEDAIDIKATLRAGWNTVTGKGRQGGSTITQQYVKNYYLGQEQTLVRKTKEFFISIKLDREQSKDEILEGYLNTSYFGRNAYGIQAASHAYYGKDVEDLDAGEGAYLASLLNAPSSYDVVTNPENKKAALARWDYVLDGMVKHDWLTHADRDAMTFPVPGKAKPATALSGQRGYIVQAVEKYLTSNKIIDEGTLATGGYRITTTLQKKKQDALVEAVKDNVLSKTSDDREADRNVRAGGASVDPATGHVVALYGGVDYTRQYVNNATRRDYQVGSTFKPFVLAAALANGSTTQKHRAITPNTRYDGTNERTVQSAAGSTGYSPANEDDVDYGSITVREATDKSVNAVYAQMAQDVGPDEVKATAIALGIPQDTPDLTPTPPSRSAPPPPASSTWPPPTPPSPTTADSAPTPSSSRSARTTRSSHYPPGTPGAPSAAKPPTPPPRSCGASSTAAPVPLRKARAAPPRARRAPPRRTRPPGSPGTPPTSPPSSPSWARTPRPASRNPSTAHSASPA